MCGITVIVQHTVVWMYKGDASQSERYGCQAEVGCIREMQVRVRDMGAKLRLDGMQHFLVAGLLVDDSLLLTENKMLQKVVDVFNFIYNGRNLKVNANKSEVDFFSRTRE